MVEGARQGLARDAAQAWSRFTLAKEKGGQRGSARLVPEARNEQAADADGGGEQLAGSA